MPSPHRMLARIAVAAALFSTVIGYGAATPVAAQSESVVIDLVAQNDSGITGTATLTADGDQTTVLIEVEGEVGGNPAHIHTGTCDVDYDPTPAYELEEVDGNGVSVTTVDVSLKTLVDTDYLVDLHQSATNLGTIVACGEIQGSANAGADTATATAAATASATVTANEVTIDLASSNDSGVTGTALFEVDAAGTRVTINAEGVLGTNDAAIYAGTCDDLDLDVGIDLTGLDENGDSVTGIDTSLADLLAGEYAVLVTDPAIALGEGSGLACGEIVGSIGGTTSGPATGAGTAALQSVNGGMVALLSLAGALVLGAGIALRRRVNTI